MDAWWCHVTCKGLGLSSGLLWIHDADDNVPLNLPQTQWIWNP